MPAVTRSQTRAAPVAAPVEEEQRPLQDICNEAFALMNSYDEEPMSSDDIDHLIRLYRETEEYEKNYSIGVRLAILSVAPDDFLTAFLNNSERSPGDICRIRRFDAKMADRLETYVHPSKMVTWRERGYVFSAGAEAKAAEKYGVVHTAQSAHDVDLPNWTSNETRVKFYQRRASYSYSWDDFIHDLNSESIWADH